MAAVRLSVACVVVATATARPAATSISTFCRLSAFARDTIPSETESKDGDTLEVVCIAPSGRLFRLGRDQATVDALISVALNDHVELELVGPTSGKQQTYTVLSARRQRFGLAAASVPSSSAPSAAASAFASINAASSRYFEGMVRIRVLSILVEVNGHVATYAGDTRASRRVGS